MNFAQSEKNKLRAKQHKYALIMSIKRDKVFSINEYYIVWIITAFKCKTKLW